MSYRELITELNLKLGIADDYAQQRHLSLQIEATDLIDVEINATGKTFRTTPATASAWKKMQQAAANERVVLQIGSAFRSAIYQAQIIEERLSKGRTLENILTGIAAPGYSEHHTGQAIDIITLDSIPFSEHFETTPAFAWLQLYAKQFGFRLSYPRDNKFGFVYEPWHWFYVE